MAETEGQDKGVGAWVDVGAIRHLAKHASANIAALLLLALFDWLLHLLESAGVIPERAAAIFEWIDFWTMVVIFVLFGLQTIAFFSRRTLNGSSSLILA